MRNKILKEFWNIDENVISFVDNTEKQIKEIFEDCDTVASYNHYKVLKAFQKNNVSDRHFQWNTGYGYDDIGREITEKVFADIFNTEAALVRTQIVNGTHALSLTLSGILRPNDKIIYISGRPYDTLEEVIGVRGENMGSLKEFGISYDQVDLKDDGNLDYEAIKNAITKDTKMVCLQRATGYSWRKAITIDEIKKAVEVVKEIKSDVVFMVDNCYGEFLDYLEPTDVGVDIMAGSLIKNPGGSLALSGGYIVGREDLIRLISYRLTCPGIGGECGLTFDQTRRILQGIFIAPQIVNGAIKGAILCGKAYENLGFEVCPKSNDKRSDIIQSIKLKDPKLLVRFCQAIQGAAPIDAFVKPEPWAMPGYEEDVVMAAGAFVQGSSIELSCDGPMRKPYIAYFQGGLSYDHSKFGVINSLNTLYKEGYIEL